MNKLKLVGAFFIGQGVRVVVLCGLWFAVSSLSGLVGKTILNEFPHPLTLTLVHLLSTALYSIPLLYYMKLDNWFSCVPQKFYWTYILPLTLLKILTTASDHLALWRIPVSYLHTVKASVPIFTVIICRLALKERQTTPIYLSLLPILTGVGIATVTELSFDYIGLLASLVTSFGGSVQTIFSKRLMKLGDVHSFELMALMARLPFLTLVPIWGVVDAQNIFVEYKVLWLCRGSNWWRLPVLFLSDGVLNFVQNILAFSILSLVSPLSYGVASATKRISVIVISLLFLHNPVTPLNISGMTLAIGGVLSYSYFRTKRNDTKCGDKLTKEEPPVGENGAQNMQI